MSDIICNQIHNPNITEVKTISSTTKRTIINKNFSVMYNLYNNPKFNRFILKYFSFELLVIVFLSFIRLHSRKNGDCSYLSGKEQVNTSQKMYQKSNILLKIASVRLCKISRLKQFHYNRSRRISGGKSREVIQILNLSDPLHAGIEQ